MWIRVAKESAKIIRKNHKNRKKAQWYHIFEHEITLLFRAHKWFANTKHNKSFNGALKFLWRKKFLKIWYSLDFRSDPHHSLYSNDAILLFHHKSEKESSIYVYLFKIIECYKI